ncbi:MAG: threonyl-tRNA synthetase editing domain-containing protein [Candidatus Micrarchaeota archaeon]
MKLLCFHAKEFRAKVFDNKTVGQQRRAEARLRKRLTGVLPKLEENRREVKLENTIVSLVCVEKSDPSPRIWDARDFILHVKENVGASSVVIVPFGHLSAEPAIPIMAKEIIHLLLKFVRDIEPSAVDVIFGYDKSLLLDVPCHPFNARFASF